MDAPRPASSPAPAPAPGATVTDDSREPPAAGIRGQDLEPGHVLAGRYRIARFIAGGGMGVVYEARDVLLGEPVAVKLLRPELLDKPGAQERFAQEIRIARRVTHPNVCRVFDVGIDGARIFFTMELHPGDTLAGLLAGQGAMEVPAAVPLVRQLLDGVAAAHAVSVVHLDLKPSNVLLAAPDGTRLAITDFGLAVPCCAELGCTCDRPHLVGTPLYMAPEQVEGGTAMERTDVFALGVILFQIVTGRLPYQGARNDEIARARLRGPAPSPRAVRSEVDGRWDEVIRRCLARDPGERPRDARAVADALGLT